MPRNIAVLLLFSIFLFYFYQPTLITASSEGRAIILDDDTENMDLYSGIEIIKDRDRLITIDDVVNGELAEKFIPEAEIQQRAGFFETGNWIHFEIENRSNQREWLLEVAFPLVHELQIYSEEAEEIVQLYDTGANKPFAEREIIHRNFIFNLEIEPDEVKTYYMWAVGSGDLHPPIQIWNQERFIEKTQMEFILLGLFYGVILVMILYNLFLYFSLRMRSYLYYVLVITFALLGKLSINGLGYQYIWPNSPEWNVVSTPFWVALACIFILIFTRNFLQLEQYIPGFNKIFYSLLPLNAFIIVLLPFSHLTSLHLMVLGTFITFSTVLISAIIALKRGARQARFYIAGWLIFLTGVFITILERTVILPFSTFTEYAGQAALTIEVVLLSLALADKIQLMRKEKEEAESKVKESKEQVIKNLNKVDELNEKLVQLNTHLEDKVLERTNELKIANENLQKMAVSRRELLANIAHELGSPLTLVHHYIQSMQHGIIAPNDLHYQKLVSDKIKVLNRLIDDLFDLSKLEAGKASLNMEEIQVKNWLVKVLHKCEFVILQENRIFEQHIQDSIENINCIIDEQRMDQLFSNLISNAIKNTDEETGKISISIKLEQSQLLILLKDNGAGISESELPFIFDRFYKSNISSSEQLGTGLGLAIVKQIVETHKGEIRVKSRINEGTTFYISLPVQHMKLMEKNEKRQSVGM